MCNPEDIRTKEQREAATVRTSSATMSLCGLVGPEARFGPGKCIFRGDKCTGKRCKVNNAPCKVTLVVELEPSLSSSSHSDAYRWLTRFVTLPGEPLVVNHGR